MILSPNIAAARNHRHAQLQDRPDLSRGEHAVQRVTERAAACIQREAVFRDNIHLEFSRPKKDRMSSLSLFIVETLGHPDRSNSAQTRRGSITLQILFSVRQARFLLLRQRIALLRKLTSSFRFA